MIRNAVLMSLAGSSAVAVGLALTVQPKSHDFGKAVTPGGGQTQWFTISVPAGGTAYLAAKISGPDAGNFELGTTTGCGPTANSCSLAVNFRPRSVGPKVATLEVSDGSSGTAQAALSGTGIPPVCTNNVVFCNYAFLYSGNFDWTTASEAVKVTIVDGVATCNGSATFEGRPKGSVNGTGLVAVEFVKARITDSTGKDGPERLVYKVTVACPSPFVPATADAAALPSRPAELGDYFRETYNQPAAEVTPRTLVGSISYPSDGEGIVSVTWSLMRK